MYWMIDARVMALPDTCCRSVVTNTAWHQEKTKARVITLPSVCRCYRVQVTNAACLHKKQPYDSGGASKKSSFTLLIFYKVSKTSKMIFFQFPQYGAYRKWDIYIQYFIDRNWSSSPSLSGLKKWSLVSWSLRQNNDFLFRSPTLHMKWLLHHSAVTAKMPSSHAQWVQLLIICSGNLYELEEWNISFSKRKNWWRPHMPHNEYWQSSVAFLKFLG
jgi:hypothetical protein